MSSAFEAALNLASKIEHIQAAKNCGFKYSGSKKEGHFSFSFLGNDVRLAFPSFEAEFSKNKKEVNKFLLTFIMYHLATCDGSALRNSWISYGDLPGGLSYVNAFRGYTAKKLVAHFDNRLDDVVASAKALGLQKIDINADAAFLFDVMPRVKVAFLYRLGDEEFEATSNFLFDASASHQLPSDCYAVMSSWFTSCLIKGQWLF